jgi:AraC-like DNA-binding protein
VEEAHAPAFSVEPAGSGEQRVSFRVGDSWCRMSNFELQGGVLMGVTVCQYEPTFAFSVVQPAAEIELVASKGAQVLAYTKAGQALPRGGTSLQLARTRSPLPLSIRTADASKTECVSITMTEARLSELLGVPTLPAAFTAVTQSLEANALVSQEMTPRLFRALDELLGADVRGAARQLWHEAKALELIALMTDELTEAARASAPQLTANDVDRLCLARKCLVERLDEPPSLAQLARHTALSETRLKGGFRTLFGTSVFAYLRQARMEEARRLLQQRRLNVTEVAQRVGYSNPSKFAAAFRRHFGVSPSAI